MIAILKITKALACYMDRGIQTSQAFKDSVDLFILPPTFMAQKTADHFPQTVTALCITSAHKQHSIRNIS